ncbi:hypothetical protein [Nitrosopumilus ureiphilus]|uniref:Uncharacterized protein n=1 Tax=Nitrosopumilus ureiphilus TaxID=1470067 RepID=A0A7D5M885_9ARCH|nr:hypothetical protein [Nitrosopumilus ureiphilus]QLH06828.1 hypothetical protein C5F50_06865 [Nitrosopumilus ureiphilus]
MQLLLSKKTSHSEATNNLVEGIPVEERENPLQIQSMPEKTLQIESIFHQTRLNIEIGMYWMLSKYQQSLHKKHHQETTK